MSQTALGRRVAEDIGRYRNNRELVRSTLFQRLTTHFVSPEVLHPNPEDEFSDPRIGPDDRIVARYCRIALQSFAEGDRKIFHDPVLVVRMKPDGYMIINGHHRWAAAVQVNAPRLRVSIVNPRNL